MLNTLSPVVVLSDLLVWVSWTHPIRIRRIRLPRFVPRVGLRFKQIRTLSALRFPKGWVRKERELGVVYVRLDVYVDVLNLRMRIGCRPCGDRPGLLRLRSPGPRRRAHLRG